MIAEIKAVSAAGAIATVSDIPALAHADTASDKDAILKIWSHIQRRASPAMQKMAKPVG